MEQKKSFFKKIHIPNLRYRFGFDADADWLFLSIVCVVLFVLVSIFNIVFFFRITNLTVETSNQTEEGKEIIDRERIMALLETYKQKETSFNTLQKPRVNVDEKPSPAIE